MDEADGKSPETSLHSVSVFYWSNGLLKQKSPESLINKTEVRNSFSRSFSIWINLLQPSWFDSWREHVSATRPFQEGAGVTPCESKGILAVHARLSEQLQNSDSSHHHYYRYHHHITTGWTSLAQNPSSKAAPRSETWWALTKRHSRRLRYFRVWILGWGLLSQVKLFANIPRSEKLQSEIFVVPRTLG